MRFYQNKGSLVASVIVGILILVATFLLIFYIVQNFQGRAEAKTSEAICRGSVALREKSYTKIMGVGGAGTPILCNTLDKYIPEDKDAAKEQAEKEIASLMAKCWNQFGEGLISDVFKE